jgi:hypothetical protein
MGCALVLAGILWQANVLRANVSLPIFIGIQNNACVTQDFFSNYLGQNRMKPIHNIYLIFYKYFI